MSSTTEAMRGQALAGFAISLTAIIIAAALAFDAGTIILERRAQQNAADAAAIAGARYVVTSPSTAESAARVVATANGFTDGVGSQAVTVSIPPASGPFAGKANFIEVEIGSTRPSLFAGIMGVTEWATGARAVATNGDSAGGIFSILALNPTGCDAMLVSGNGTLLAYGNIQVNSSCSDGALRRQGEGNIRVDVPSGACDVVGDIKDGGGQGLLKCIHNEGAPVMPDPILKLPDPAMPNLADPMVQVVGSMSIPTGCPGSANPATLAAPNLCQFSSSYAGTIWRISPGLYPGGLKLQGGTFYFQPGVYYLAGGGLTITGSGTTSVSVETGGSMGPAGGVMFYNTGIEGSAIGKILLNGGQAAIDLLPLNDGSRYSNLLIFQDRAHDINGDDVTINGNSATMVVRGTIYVPAGDVKVNGGSGKLRMDQTIASNYVVHGSSGSEIQVLEEEEYTFKLLAAGLVE